MSHPGRVTRRWFLGVTVATLIAGDVWFLRRKNRLLERALACRAQAAALSGDTEREAAGRRHSLDLARKYEHAASRPWLKVEPEAPSPFDSRIP